MPTIEGGGKLRGPRRRAKRRSVSLLTTTLSRREREAAGLPPSAWRDSEPRRRAGSCVWLLVPPPRTVRQRSAARRPWRRRRSGGSAKSTLTARLRLEDPPAVSDIGCARGRKRLRTPGTGKHSPRLLSRSQSRRRLSPRSQRPIRAEQAPKRQTHPWLRSPTRIRAKPAPRIHQI